MSYSVVKRSLAAAAFLLALATYLLTLPPSIGFWRSPELSAAAYWQQVPQPIVGPLWLVLARCFQIVAPVNDPALAANFLSAFASAGTVAVLFLIITCLVERWYPLDAEDDARRATPVLLGGLAGALSFAWIDTQWSLATIAAVEPLALFVASLALLAMLRWEAHPTAPRAEGWLLLVCFLVGTTASLDARLLLIVPALGLIFFHRQHEYTSTTVVSLVVMLTAGWYFVIDGYLRSWPAALVDGNDWFMIAGVPAILLVAAVFWRSRIERGRPVALAVMGAALAFIGASTVFYLPVRSAAHPAINAMSTRSDRPAAEYLRLTGGDEKIPMWPRRDPLLRANGDTASGGLASELGFLWGYQVEHMYLRYLFWNFVGRDDDLPGASSALLDGDRKAQLEGAPSGVDPFPLRYYGLPLLLALIGVVLHFRYDWRMALALLTGFALTGLGVVVVANLQPGIPRERDYLFAASFMILAIWIGVGTASLAGARGTEDGEGSGGWVLGVIALAAVPLNLLLGGWTAHDRSSAWAPWDFAYNLLQSCAPNAILFTAADNDTFPLLYLQDAAGVRRDVRVVNLAMSNDLSYIDRERNERPWSAEPLPVGVADSLVVGGGDAVGAPQSISIPVPLSPARSRTSDSARSAMHWVLRGPSVAEGLQMLRVQDRMIADVLRRNAWHRPIYFSASVPREDRAGLDDYLRREGLALRVMPIAQAAPPGSDPIDAERTRRLLIDVLPGRDYDTAMADGFKMRGLGHASGYLTPEERSLVATYRQLYLALAQTELDRTHDRQSAHAVLDKMEEVLPSGREPLSYWMAAAAADLYARMGDSATARTYASRSIDAVNRMGSRWREHPQAGVYHPIQIKAEMLELLGRYDAAIDTYVALLKQYPHDYHLRGQLDEVRINRHLNKGDTAAAIREIDEIVAGYAGNSDPAMQNNASAFRELRDELSGKP